MKLFKRSVESRQFKREMASFYKKKVKPVLLSIKHFFKSSHKFFKNHPRLRIASIVGGIFLFIVIASIVANTFSKDFITSNILAAKYEEYTDEFWHKMSRGSSYSRPVESFDYIRTGEACADDHCGMEGDGTESNPYQITNVTQFLFVRSLGRNGTTEKISSIGKFFVVTNNLDFTGIELTPLNTDNYNNMFSGYLDGNFKHFKGVSVGISGNDRLNANGLIPAIYSVDTFAAVVKNIIIDDLTMNISGEQGSGMNAVGGVVGYVGTYGYVLNCGVLSGSIGIGTISNNLNVGSVVGRLANPDGISVANYPVELDRNISATRNGMVNNYSYAQFNFTGSFSTNTKIGGVLGFRADTNGFMNEFNSLFYANNYYGHKVNGGANDSVFQFVYNGTKISATISPHLSYYWFKGDDVNNSSARDIPSNASDQTYAIAQNADYLQSDGFVANLNASETVLRYYFTSAWGNTDIARRLIKDTYTDVEWYISRSDFADTGRPYFPILRAKTQGREKSSKIAGTVAVHFSGNGHNDNNRGDVNLTVTNQDESIDDYVYRKITLPFADEVLSSDHYTNGSYTMTLNGWRLKKVVANGVLYDTPGNIAGMNFDYTLRTEPSAYTKNINEVFAEGGYYLLPDGVTELYFEAVWAYTIYLGDSDVQKNFTARTYQTANFSYCRNGVSYCDNEIGSGNGFSQNAPVTSLAAAYNAANGLSNNSDPYNTIIMLVRNYHEPYATTNSTTQSADWVSGTNGVRPPITIRSLDRDGDRRPDYAFYMRSPGTILLKGSNDNTYTGSLRFDFVNLLGIPQVAGYSGMLNSFKIDGKNRFETTETVVTDHITLFTYNSSYVKILGGYFDIYSSQNDSIQVPNTYLIFGGTARAGDIIATSMKQANGEAGKPDEWGRIINIVGGRAKLVSFDKNPIKAFWGILYTYIDGGYIDSYYSVYMGEMQFKLSTNINHSYINECYGGGYADSSFNGKGLTLKINDSRIGTLFGGPKFGEIYGVIDLYINDSELDTVYGGGYGGTNYFTFPNSRYSNAGDSFPTTAKYPNIFSASSAEYSLYIQFLTKFGGGGDDGSGNKQFRVVDYKTKIYSINGQRYSYVEDVLGYLSNSKVQGVTFNISDSKVNENIYGGGNRGFVEGDIRFNLHNVTVMGNIFGAGYSDDQDTVLVNTRANNNIKYVYPTFYNYAIDSEYYDPFDPKNPTASTVRVYPWRNVSSMYNSRITNAGVPTKNAGTTGVVTAGNIYVTLSGDSTGKYPMYVDKNVYGGGDHASVNLTNEIHLNILDGVHVHGNVFGGGNMNSVNGNTNVIVENYDSNNRTIIDGGVYAGGNGNAEDGIEVNVNGTATVTIAGNPKIYEVYGGGNSASASSTNVYIEGGEIDYVYGGSNKAGTIGTSNVYIGQHSPKERSDGYVEDVDLCSAKLFDVSIDYFNPDQWWRPYDANLPQLVFRNRTGVTFDSYTIKVYFTDQTVAAIGNNGLSNWGVRNYRSYSGGVLTVTEQSFYTGDPYPLNAHGEIFTLIRFDNNPAMAIDRISFEGYSGKNVYSFTDCAISKLTGNPDGASIPTTEPPKSYPTKMSNIKVNNIFGSNNKGGRTLKTNILVLPNNYITDSRYRTGPYTVEVGNVFGGGNETQTGPDVEHGPNIENYKVNSDGWVDFQHEGWKFVPEYKSRIVIYGAHVTGDVYGGGLGNETKSDNTTLSAMYSTPMILVTNNAQIDGSVFGGGYATNAPIGRLIGTSQNPDYSRSTFIKPMVFIDWGTVNGNVYGGGYGDVVNGGTMVYGTLFNPYGISDYVKKWYFQMENDTHANERHGKNETDRTSPYRGLTTVNAGNHGSSPVHVHIKGSMYGGGERGAKENAFDYTFESVIDGTTVYLQEDKNICLLDVDGDVFGSGNFSSSAGYSDILILNIGEYGNPKKMKSIQRAEHVYINGSFIELSGGTDITNKFNRTKYSFSRIGKLRNGINEGGIHLGDNSILYLKAQANMVNNLWSSNGWTWMKDNGWTFLNPPNFNGSFEGGLNTVQFGNYNNDYVTIDGERFHYISRINNNPRANDGSYNLNINRIYLLDDHGLNIIPTEDVQNSFGAVHGMTFFGVYEEGANGQPNMAYYGRGYDLVQNRTQSGLTKKDFNAYILSGHTSDRNKDGFITNVYNPGNRKVYTVIVDPTPENEAYHYWTIGNPVIAQEITLTASKYIRSGMKGVTLYNYAHEDYNRVIFEIAGVDVSGLKTEADFIDPKAVPTLAENDEDALKTFGLNIETSDAGWVNEGYTYFDSDYNGGNRTSGINGTTRYEAAGASDFPTLIFNLENSRNIKSTEDLGYITITITAHAFREEDAITSVNSTFKIRVNMDTYYYEDNEYESSMAPGKHYRPFLSAPTNITANSEFSTYFNMYAYGKDLYQHYKETQYATAEDVVFDHVLYSTYVLPVGTRITMLDISTNDPKYYYYIVQGNETLEIDHHKKTTDGTIAEVYEYPLSWFRSMDSTTDGDRYDEDINRSRYVVPDGNTISTAEQFIFTIDFKDVQQHTKSIDLIKNEEVFMGLRTTIGGVSKIQSDPMYETMQDMHFSLYDSNSINFKLDLLNTPTEDDTIYVDDTFTFDANVTVKDDPIDNTYVRNTNYYQDRLGLRLGLYHITEDDEGNEKATLVSGDELAGAIFYVNGLGYASGANGFVRLKMADYVVTVLKDIQVDLTNAEHLTSGLYEFRVTAFASADGLYAKQGDNITNSSESFRVYLVNEHYGLSASIDDEKDVIVYSNGKTSGGNDTIETTINYFGSYGNPNVRISLKRRDYNTVESYIYNDVNIADYFDISSTTFSDTSQLDRTDLFDLNTMTISKDALASHITASDMGVYKLTLKLKPGVDLPTGTYRIMYNLYNANKEVGDVYTYIIIKD